MMFVFKLKKNFGLFLWLINLSDNSLLYYLKVGCSAIFFFFFFFFFFAFSERSEEVRRG